MSSVAHAGEENFSPRGRAEIQFADDWTCLLRSDHTKGQIQSRTGVWQIHADNIITYTLNDPTASMSWNYSFEGQKMKFFDTENDILMCLVRIQDFTLK